MNKRIAQIVVGLPVAGPFDYAIGKGLETGVAVGQRVRVSFNRRNRVGFVVGLKGRSKFKKINPVLSTLDNLPVLDNKSLKWTKIFSDYYGCSWGEAIETYLPTALRKDKVVDMKLPAQKPKAGGAKGQITLLHDVSRRKYWTHLKEEIKQALAKKRSVIFLVPEVSLIGEIVTKLEEDFSSQTAVLDKKITPKQELEQWVRIKAGQIPIVVGTRSAIFAPTPNLGLIVIFDEENTAYKQEQSPHYHVHEIAQMRADIDKCKICFVSSTPSAEVWQSAKKKAWNKVTLLPERLSDVQLIDMTNYNPQRSSIISFPLQNAIQKFLEEGKKIVLLMNRRGFTTLTRCQHCSFTLKCERCNANLIYLYSKKVMVCRYCNFKTELPKVCPSCNSSYLRSMGTGIEKLESEVTRLYPHAMVHRFDKETEDVPKNANLIIATSAILKRQESLGADLVAMISFDAELNRMDFRSGERAFALLVHLRQLAKEKLMVQSRMVDDYCLKALKKMNFSSFYQKELKLRRELGFPPYRHLVSLLLRGSDEDAVFEQSQQLHESLEKNKPKDVEISEAHQDVHYKLRDQYRYSIILKGKNVKPMLEFAKSTVKKTRRKKGTIITINVDP